MQQVEELQAEGSGSQQQNVGCKANQGWTKQEDLFGAQGLWRGM